MRSVLIVDDAAFMRLLIKSALEKNGFAVIGEAGNGREAVKFYKTLKPDIVTMDITMPDMTGLEALSSIMEFDSKAKIVMISSMGQEAFVREAVIKGAKSFLVKPFKENQLVKTLEKVIIM